MTASSRPDPTPPPGGLEPEVARRLSALLAGSSAGPVTGPSSLRTLIDLWCQTLGAPGAALYGASGSAADGAATGEAPLERLVTTGEGAFPDRLEASEGSGEDWLSPSPGSGLGRLDFAGGAVLWVGAPGDGFAVEKISPLLPLLTAAVHIRSLEGRLKRHRFQVRYRGVELEALYDVGLAIASTLDLDALTQEILLRAVSLLDARRGALYLRSQEGGQDLHRRVAQFGGGARERVAADGDQRDLEALGLLPEAEHSLTVPIAVDGTTRGLLAMADKESRTGVGPFSEEDRRSLALFANQAAIALENARLHREALEKERLERDLQLAAEIQRQILPRGVPEAPGYELAGWNRPAREVGGDYYDLVRLEGDRLGVVLGDVSGKGVPAALLVSTLHSALRLLLGRVGVGSDLLEELNRHVLESSASNKFITLMVAELDLAAGRLDYVNAGHNPGFLLRRDGSLVQLTSGGLPVGLLPGGTFRADSVELGPGDLLCLYSDGITEATSSGDEEYGEERFLEILGEVRDLPLDEVVQRISAAVDEFSRGAPQADDETLVLVRRLDA